MLGRLLETDGYQVDSVAAAPDALRAVALKEPDLVLLDVMLDGEDGRDLLREIRLIANVPVVFLTGRGSEIDRIVGLRMGADDYIVKPFSPGELAARVATVLRRTAHRPRRATDELPIEYGDLRIDPVCREVYVKRELVPFTAKEFDLLAFLAASPAAGL